MRRRHQTKTKKIGEINVAPLIDIIFILVIFFMVSSTLIVHPGMKVKVPDSKTSKTVKKRKLTVYVDENKNIYLNKKKVDKKELNTKIKKHIATGGTPLITVQADKKVDYGTIINVIDICKEGGIKDISFATKKVNSINYNE